MPSQGGKRAGAGRKKGSVLFNKDDSAFVPEPLRGLTYYRLDPRDSSSLADYDKLLLFFSGKGGTSPSPLGLPKSVERRNADPLRFGFEPAARGITADAKALMAHFLPSDIGQSAQATAPNEQKDQNAAERQNLFLSLEQSLTDVITNNRQLRFVMFPRQLLEMGLRQPGYQEESNADFVKHSSIAVKNWEIPLQNRFQRQRLFRNLARLFLESAARQRASFEAALSSKIDDTSARLLIMQSIAENDLETLRAYGVIGIDYNVLNEFPKFAAEEKRLAALEKKSPKRVRPPLIVDLDLLTGEKTGL
jgi:hypothetical protein